MVKLSIYIGLSGLSGILSASAQYEMRHTKAYYMPESWTYYNVVLTEQGNLKELFDSGLRPEYMNGSENYSLTIKHARIRFALSNGDNLPEFAVEYSSIDVNRSGILRMEFVSQPLGINEAGETMSHWITYFSEKRHKTKDELNEFLKNVAADYSGYDDPNFGVARDGFGGGWKSNDGVGYGVRFQKSYNELLPVRICFSVTWDYVRSKKERRDSYDTPIPPPEGYEIKPALSTGPDDASEMMYAKGISFLQGGGLGGSVSNVIERIDDVASGKLSRSNRNEIGKEDDLAKKHVEVRSKSKHSLFWIAGGVLLLGVILIFKSWKGKAKRQ